MRRRFALRTLSLTCLALSIQFATSCLDEMHPGQYYTFQGNTVASYLEENSEQFSDFITILKRANVWGELTTYGAYTCFAPTNKAINLFVKERGKFYNTDYNSVDDLSDEDCDTLAWTHIMEQTCFVAEMVEGYFPKVNKNDRFLQLTFDSTFYNTEGDSSYRLVRCVNIKSHIIHSDDTCQNGVVHIIDRCIDFSGNYIYDAIYNDRKIHLFGEALRLCGLQDSFKVWYDDSYKIGIDSIEKGVPLSSAGNKYTVKYWDRRKTCFTFLVEPDEVYNKAGIYTIEQLIDYAKNIYDESYPNDADVSDFTDRRNSLNRFVSYHILPFQCGYNSFNPRSDIVSMYNKGIIDPEDYFETFCPHTLMRISTSKDKNIYINRRDKEGNGTKDFKGKLYPGIRIRKPSEIDSTAQLSHNGVYHYIDDILTYSTLVRDTILDRRIRVDVTTLSPDFMTSGRRQRVPEADYQGSGFKNPTNFHTFNEDFVLSLRDASTHSYAYEGDGIDIQGNFDMYVKLPPIPHDGTWQFRMSFRSNAACGIVQQYWAEGSPEDWQPLGIPSDLRVDLTDPSVGWIIDSDLPDAEAVDALDKSMKNRGWMKGADSQLTNNGTLHRDQNTMGRRILYTGYMYANRDYYLRLKQILDNSQAEMLFDYIELVPKNVYDNGEDWH